jgi:hypothetical protein
MKCRPHYALHFLFEVFLFSEYKLKNENFSLSNVIRFKARNVLYDLEMCVCGVFVFYLTTLSVAQTVEWWDD